MFFTSNMLAGICGTSPEAKPKRQDPRFRVARPKRRLELIPANGVINHIRAAERLEGIAQIARLAIDQMIRPGSLRNSQLFRPTSDRNHLRSHQFSDLNRSQTQRRQPRPEQRAVSPGLSPARRSSATWLVP